MAGTPSTTRFSAGGIEPLFWHTSGKLSAKTITSERIIDLTGTPFLCLPFRTVRSRVIATRAREESALFAGQEFTGGRHPRTSHTFLKQ
jgi:hypothetical protein